MMSEEISCSSKAGVSNLFIQYSMSVLQEISSSSSIEMLLIQCSVCFTGDQVWYWYGYIIVFVQLLCVSVAVVALNRSCRRLRTKAAVPVQKE